MNDPGGLPRAQTKTCSSLRRWGRLLWAALPVRALLPALVTTLLLWGRFLLPSITINPEAQLVGIHPHCRVGTERLTCQTRFAGQLFEDPLSPAAVNCPADYFFRRALDRGEDRPLWNPYVGSGYPIALDGHNARLSFPQWWLSHFPGDQTRDILVFVRFFLWTFAIVWAVALHGGGVLLLWLVALAATMAPYGAMYVDIVFLDVDLLSPWFLLILLGFVRGALSLRWALGLAAGLGLLVGSLAFQQAQIVLVIAMGVLTLLAAPATRGRSLTLAAALAVGVLLVLPSWLPLLANLDQFVTSRTIQCISRNGAGGSELLVSTTLAGLALLPFVPRRLWYFPVALALLLVWMAAGLPQVTCNLPLVSGLRFSRHLQPHIQMLFVFTTAIAIHELGQRLPRSRWPLLVYSLVYILSLGVLCARPFIPDAIDEPKIRATFFCVLAGAVLGVFALVLTRQQRPRAHAAGRTAFVLGLALLVFPPYAFGISNFFSPSNFFPLITGQMDSAQIAPLPSTIDASTPLGQVQKRSQDEDRRHYSPDRFLYPNWSAALGVLDVRSLNALYPVGYYLLNGGLSSHWKSDPQHGIKPDRFTETAAPALAVSVEFQRVLAVNRVSLFTFSIGRASFARPPSPYEASNCQLLGKDLAQGSESYVCPQIGGVGFFPEVVAFTKGNSGSDVVDALRQMSPSDLARTAILGPEIDPAAPAAGPGAGRVVRVQRTANDLIYTLDVDRAGLFVVADTYFRGWSATVNGDPVAISRANMAFKAVLVPKGRVELKLHFALAYF
jgi:hypothetical protein